MKRDFSAFLDAVNAEVNKLCGKNYNDLPDYFMWDDYEAGTTPKELAQFIVNSAKYSGFLKE